MFSLKYRPKNIKELDNSRVKNQLSEILKSDRLPQVYLFIGEKGTGKTSTARIFGKALNCLNNDYGKNSKLKENFEPCNKCLNCLSIDNGNFNDVIEIDAASNRGIEEVKNLIRESSFSPMSGKYRVFIIDEAHMITNEGFNALLKTLEEPPKTAVFIMATTNPEKIPKTIISRCLKVNFGKALKKDIFLKLKKIGSIENLDYEDNFYKLISEHSDNSFRDAVKILEEVAIQKIKKIEDLENYLGIRGKNNLLEIIEKKSQKEALEWINQFYENGGNFKNLIEEMLKELRIYLLAKRGIETENKKTINLSFSQITKLIRLLLEAYQQLKSTPIDSIPLEIAIAEFYNSNN